MSKQKAVGNVPDKEKTSSGALFATLRSAVQKTINALCAEKKLPSLKTVHTNAAEHASIMLFRILCLPIRRIVKNTKKRVIESPQEQSAKRPRRVRQRAGEAFRSSRGGRLFHSGRERLFKRNARGIGQRGGRQG